MKEITTNNQTILLVEVPEDATDFRLRNGYIWYKKLDSFDHLAYKLDACIWDKPQGKYQILGKSTELSEEQMKEICERGKIPEDQYYRTYPYKEYTSHIQESYLSLLEANGIDNNKNHLVLKRI